VFLRAPRGGTIAPQIRLFPLRWQIHVLLPALHQKHDTGSLVGLRYLLSLFAFP